MRTSQPSLTPARPGPAVCRVCCRPLRSLSLCVCRRPRASAPTPCEEDAVEWRVLVRKTGEELYASMEPDGVLEPGQRVFLVASVPEPTFLGREPYEELGGVVSALMPNGRVRHLDLQSRKLGNTVGPLLRSPATAVLLSAETWTTLPPWRLTVDAVLRGDLLPFGGAPPPPPPLRRDVDLAEVADVLASLSCCPVDVELRLEGRAGLSERVRRLLGDAGLRPARAAPAAPQGAVGLLVGSGPPEAPLHGALALLLVRSPALCFLRLRARDVRHVFLLAHRLVGGLPQHTKLTAVADDRGRRPGDEAGVDRDDLVRDLLRALEDELGALAAPAAPTLTRAALHPLELATDRAAQRLRVASA
ncbi:Putative cystathionine gamma-lyase [Frankliniella fusca]|uniref:Cystathionine gamma-lyase n=1 Tax=Frankliniella fusca TaxID=407009 RepID=A0AAE1L8V0_9NEOP|nr:Putative cystathionine gamma-lyase [Frankliniella fusca]